MVGGEWRTGGSVAAEGDKRDKVVGPARDEAGKLVLDDIETGRGVGGGGIWGEVKGLHRTGNIDSHGDGNGIGSVALAGE